MAQPVARQAMTSSWSPKMERACVAMARAAIWNTVEVSSPAILYMLGIIRRRPCEAVNVVVNAPVLKAPWTAPAAPASDCISTTVGTVPQMFFRPSADSSSATSPIVEEGVIGYIAITSFVACATVPAAVFPSMVTIFLAICEILLSCESVRDFQALYLKYQIVAMRPAMPLNRHREARAIDCCRLICYCIIANQNRNGAKSGTFARRRS